MKRVAEASGCPDGALWHSFITVHFSSVKLLLHASLALLVSVPILGESAEPSTSRLPKVIVPFLNGEVVIDGKMDESVWKRAAVLHLSPIRSRSSESGAEPAVLRLWYDEEALFLGWFCEDSDLRSTMTERDSRFWEEEVVEAFITKSDLSRYFELEWTALNGVFDAIIVNKIAPNGMTQGIEGDWSWTAEGMQSAAGYDGTMMNSDDRDRAWWVEVRLPFSALDSGTPAPGETWRANFFHINRFGWQAPVSSAWSPPPPGTFHQPSFFGSIVFAGASDPTIGANIHGD